MFKVIPNIRHDYLERELNRLWEKGYRNIQMLEGERQIINDSSGVFRPTVTLVTRELIPSLPIKVRPVPGSTGRRK